MTVGFASGRSPTAMAATPRDHDLARPGAATTGPGDEQERQDSGPAAPATTAAGPETPNDSPHPPLTSTSRVRLTRPQPVHLALVAIEVAALMLPRRYRTRYDREFLAELYEMPPREQVRYAVDVLTHTWHLSSVLRERPPTESDGD